MIRFFFGGKRIDFGPFIQGGAKRFITEQMFARAQGCDRDSSTPPVGIADRNDIARDIAKQFLQVSVCDLHVILGGERLAGGSVFFAARDHFEAGPFPDSCEQIKNVRVSKTDERETDIHVEMKRPAAASRWITEFGWVRKIEAGQWVATGPNKASCTGLRLAFARHDDGEVTGAEQRRNGHGQRVRRHGAHRGKTAIVHLLLAACGIKRDYFNAIRIVKVRDRRIVKSEMPVLTDAEANEIDRSGSEQRSIARTFLRRIRISRPANGLRAERKCAGANVPANRRENFADDPRKARDIRPYEKR
jgi:hypothetical protein